MYVTSLYCLLKEILKKSAISVTIYKHLSSKNNSLIYFMQLKAGVVIHMHYIYIALREYG